MRASIITLFCLSIISCEVKKDANVAERKVDNLESLLQRGEFHLERAQYAEAIADLSKVYMQKSEVKTGHLLADAYLESQQSRIALETMQDVVLKHPSSLQSKLKLSEFQFVCKQYAKAQQTLQSIRRQDPENAESYFMDGLIHEEKEEGDLALAAYRNATKSDPELLDAWIHTGLLLSRQKDPDADRYFAAALAIQPDHIPTLHARAVSLAAQENIAAAKQTYREILDFNPDYTDAYYNLALLYFDQDSLQAARTHFGLAVKTNPQFANGYFYRGLSAEYLEDLESARLDYQVALRLDPEHENAADGLARVTPPE